MIKRHTIDRQNGDWDGAASALRFVPVISGGGAATGLTAVHTGAGASGLVALGMVQGNIKGIRIREVEAQIRGAETDSSLYLVFIRGSQDSVTRILDQAFGGTNDAQGNVAIQLNFDDTAVFPFVMSLSPENDAYLGRSLNRRIDVPSSGGFFILHGHRGGTPTQNLQGTVLVEYELD